MPGERYSFKGKKQYKDMQQRIMAGWVTYAKHRELSNGNPAVYLNGQVYNSCVLPAMTCRAGLTLTKPAQQNKLVGAQTKMERRRPVFNITYKDRMANI